MSMNNAWFVSEIAAIKAATPSERLGKALLLAANIFSENRSLSEQLEAAQKYGVALLVASVQVVNDGSTDEFAKLAELQKSPPDVIAEYDAGVLKMYEDTTEHYETELQAERNALAMVVEASQELEEVVVGDGVTAPTTFWVAFEAVRKVLASLPASATEPSPSEEE